jgi:hypothetical protein
MVSSGMVAPGGKRLKPVSTRQGEPSLHETTISEIDSAVDSRRCGNITNGTPITANFLTVFSRLARRRRSSL